jgi:ABC-2 type transport system ATP-binding protein
LLRRFRCYLTTTIAWMTLTPALEFESISKRYARLLSRKERWALRDFSLHVDKGEIVGFLGPNGAGKTTAINIALGLARPTSGRGTLLGHQFGNVAPRAQIGFLSENPAFYHQSASKTLKLSGSLNGVREPELSQRASQLLEAVGLSDESTVNIGKFSRGMLQRLGIAQALVNDPELLILDEPTSALDPLSRVQVRELILKMRAQGKSVFLSSHQLSEVELVCDRIVFVEKGRVIASGKTHELLQSSGEFEVIATGLKIVPTTARDVQRQTDRLTFTVAAKDQRAAIEQIWAAGGTLVNVTPKARTLEELFIDLFGKSELFESSADRRAR